MLPPEQPLPTADRRMRVAHWIAENDLSAAEREIEAALAQSPDDAAWHQLRGLAAHRGGRNLAAISAFETAALLAPLSGGSQLALAECLLRTGQKDLARTVLSDPLLIDRLPALLLAPLARCRSMAGDAAGALAACRYAAARFPDDDEPLRGMAFYMNRMGCAPNAILIVMRQAWRLRPDWPPYRLSIALLLDRLGRTAEARDFARPLTPDFICEMECRGCVARLLNIFSRPGDEANANACRRRMKTLHADDAARLSPGSCCNPSAGTLDAHQKDES